MWIALGGIAVNGITAWLFSRGHEDINIRATFLHMLADAGVSAGVVAGAVLIGLTGLGWVDPAVSLCIVVIIVAGTWGTLRDAVNLAVDGVPAPIVPQEVEGYLRGLPGVMEVHDLHIWALSTTETALTAHLVHVDAAVAEQIIQPATRGLARKFHIGHSTLQLESVSMAAACRLRPADVV
jgi:cobalt-zinc-cadmium efflux system protein